MIAKASLVACVILMAGCTAGAKGELDSVESSQAIVGGEGVSQEAAARNFPWVAAILDKSYSTQWWAEGAPRPSGSICGGSVVGSGDWIITAAHCVTNEAGKRTTPGRLLVGVGRALLSELKDNPDNVNTFAVTEVLVHPDYDAATVDSDVALLRLSARAPVPSVPIASDTVEGEMTTMIGWGDTIKKAGNLSDEEWDAAKRHFPNRLRTSSARLTTLEECRAAFEPLHYRVFPRNLCVSTRSNDTCQGDSGGPLLVRRDGGFAIAGLTSWGEGCKAGYPGVYSNLGAIRLTQWVRSNLR